MCYFMTVAVPAETPEHQLRALLQEHGKTFESLRDSVAVSNLFDDPVHYGSTTRDHCDCGTVVGSRARAEGQPDPTEQEREIEKQIRKYKRKGWRDGRSQEWACRRRQTMSAANEAARKNALIAADAWVQLLRALAGLSADGRVWLLLHSYSGDLNQEHVQLRRRQTVQIADATPELILCVEEDVLYEFRRRRNG
ncbi:MAG: hypothetical protein JXB13_12405 [Phycisphaerae bacterium]|nr:hypothetical protein [Phycisphaerae bacterium]